MSGKRYKTAAERASIDDADGRDGHTAANDPFTDDDVTSILDDAWDDLSL